MKYIATVNGKTYTIEINREDRILCEGVERTVDFRLIDQQHLYSLLLDNASYEALIHEREGEYWVFLRGYLFTVQVEEERERRLREASGGRLGPTGEVAVKAPMPGLIVAVPVQEGQPVRKGEKLVLLESMKMQNEILAPRDGVVKAVRVRPGQSVEQNQILVVLR